MRKEAIRVFNEAFRKAREFGLNEEQAYEAASNEMIDWCQEKEKPSE